MASCEPCGRLTIPVLPTNTCPCTIPIVGDDLPKTMVNPCVPGAGPADPCQPGVSVAIPIMQSVPPPPLPKPKRKCRYIQPPRPRSFAPHVKYCPPEMKMEDNTIYRKSYLPVDGEKVIKVIPESNLCVGEGKMSDHTINRMSYLPHKILPPCPIIPCEHKLLGEGPMQDITTQKHDYVPKPMTKLIAIKPSVNLYTSDCPLSDKTINRLSYQPIDLRKAKVTPIHPTNAIGRACGKISDKTVHNMSYQPWEPMAPMDMPWARKPMYCPPKLRMEDNTICRMSYTPPGQYVECDDNDMDAMDCPEPPCGTHCTRPCCCPRAAC